MHAACLGFLLVAVPLALLPSAQRPARDATPPLDQSPAEPATLKPVPFSAYRHGHRIERVGGGLLSFGGFGDAGAPVREMRQTWWLAAGSPGWQRRADMKVARAFFSSAVVDGAVYAIGDGIERYDLATDRWVEILPAGSLPRSHFGAAAVGRSIFVLGGVTPDLPALSVVDLDTGKLREEAPPPGFGKGDHFHCVHALDGKLHVFGGLDGEEYRPKAEHWILTAEGWKQQAAPPEALWAKFCAQAVAGGNLYLFGDFGALRYDPRSSAWTRRAKLEPVLVMPQMIELDGALWVIGGMQVDALDRPILFRHDIAKDAWDLAPAGVPPKAAGR